MMRHVEDTLQRSCVEWFGYQYPSLSWALFHVPNGGRRDPREAARFKGLGVRPGVPDLFLILPSGDGKFHYLALELKIGKNTQTDYQRQYEININRNGGRYVVIRSLDQFIEEIKNYLKK